MSCSSQVQVKTSQDAKKTTESPEHEAAVYAHGANKLYTLNPKPAAFADGAKPCTLNPKPYTLNPKP